MGKYETKKNKAIRVVLTIMLVLILLSLIATACFFNFEIVIDTATLPSVIEYGEECQTPNAYLRGRFFLKDNIVAVDVLHWCHSNGLGEHVDCYRASYFLYSNEIEYNVLVLDTQRPTIELKTDDDKLTPVGGEYVEEGFSAYDNYDGDITDRVAVSIDGDIVTYSVQDSSGNSCSVEREIRYEDLTPPTIELNGDSKIFVTAGEKYVELGATANDNLDGDITNKIIISDTLNTNKVGTYTLIYDVQDEHGNKATTYRTVEVVDYMIAPKNGKIIYLTFDDGPSQHTPRLLDVLDKYHVKATFFVIGNADYADTMRDIVNRGHVIGSHSITHNYKKIYSDDSVFMDELYETQKVIYNATGVKTYLMRFPGGSSNTVSRKYNKGVMTRLTAAVEEKGFTYFDWDVDSGDTDGKASTPEEIFENITARIQDYEFATILQHDIKGYSVDAVESVIRWGLENGYTFDVLSETSYIPHHELNN